MKTFARLVSRYVLAVAAMALLLIALLIGGTFALSYAAKDAANEHLYASWQVANALTKTDDGFVFDDSRTTEEWMEGYVWAMVLDDDGNVIWQLDLPDELDHHYTSGDIAAFARWYLDGYPVFCRVKDYGLFVIGMEPESLWRTNIYEDRRVIEALISLVKLAVILVPMLMSAGVVFVSWHSTHKLQTVSSGLDALANGRTVNLPTRGFTAEVAERLNQASAQLQARNEIIARRDNTRTQWIAGVSHDIRTPLALIMGWAEQLEADSALPTEARERAGGIRRQGEKLRSLIEDLNLTSKLQYGAQPLRRQPHKAGPLVRTWVAQFCDSPLAERCEVSVEQSDAAEQTVLSVDPALLGRAVENLLNNSASHNEAPVRITVRADRAANAWCLTITDDGAGYPPAVLASLEDPERDEANANAPHILGLHVVEQIAQAHGGTASFAQNIPHGAQAVLHLPVEGEN